MLLIYIISIHRLQIVKQTTGKFICINCTWFVVYIKHQVHVLLLPGWEMSLFYVLQTVSPHLQPFVLCYLRILETERIWEAKSNICWVLAVGNTQPEYRFTKTVPWFTPMHKERNKLCLMYPLIYGSVL